MKLYRRKSSNRIWFLVGRELVSAKKLFGMSLKWDNKKHVKLAEKLIRDYGERRILEKTGFITGDVPRIAVEEAVSHYRLYGRIGKAESTCNREDEIFIQIERFLKAIEMDCISDFGFSQVQAYQAFRTRKGIKSSTINREMNVLRSLLRHCKKQGWIGKIPEVPHLPQEKPLKRILTRQEFRYLLNKSREYSEPVFRFLILGIYIIARPSELLNLKIGDIDREARTIRVIRAKTSKSGQPVTNYPLHANLEGELMTWNLPANPSLPIIRPEKTDKPYTYHGFKAIWNRFLRFAEFEHFPMKTLRATSETWLLEETGDIHLAANLAGHSVSTAEKHYLEAGLHYLRKGVDEGQSHISRLLARPDKRANVVPFDKDRRKKSK